MPDFEQFRLPDVGEGLTEAEIVEWHVAVGDTVTVNQTIVEIETAKSMVELPSPYAGAVAELLVEPGTTVEVGMPIIVIDVDPTGPPAKTRVAEPARGVPAAGAGTSVQGGGGAVLVGYGVAGSATARRPRRAAASVQTAEPTPPPTADPTPSLTSNPAPSPAAARSSHVLAKPPVRKLARDLEVDLESVTPTGPGGIVTREDVLAQSAEGEARRLATYPGDDQPWLASGRVSAGGRQTRMPVKSVRKRTAEAMVASAFTAPHVTVFHTIDVTKTMKLVARLRADREFADVRVTPLLITAKATLLAVRRHPEINASWDEAAQEIVYKHYVNLGIAASTPRGLVVPNIKDAHRMGLKELAEEIANLTATARAGRTTPTEMSDGTITITNVGAFGIDTGTPILNPGEAAILAFGAIREQPWVHRGAVKKRWVTQLALSFDHRLVDGALGSVFLSDVAAVLADPSRGLVWG
ncbi:MAG TPA: dihydrolipoamide acetyltransferase family protein [Pengzhenrongella sp.]